MVPPGIVGEDRHDGQPHTSKDDMIYVVEMTDKHESDT
jgi:hypothetical protein